MNKKILAVLFVLIVVLMIVFTTYKANQSDEKLVSVTATMYTDKVILYDSEHDNKITINWYYTRDDLKEMI